MTVLSHDTQIVLQHVREMWRARRPAAAPDVCNDAGKFKKFYQSRGWKAARYRYLKSLKPGERRCACCGATARDSRLVVDHIIPIRTEEGWRRRLTGPFQILCNDDNFFGKGSKDQTDFRLIGKKEDQNDD